MQLVTCVYLESQGVRKGKSLEIRWQNFCKYGNGDGHFSGHVAGRNQEMLDGASDTQSRTSFGLCAMLPSQTPEEGTLVNLVAVAAHN